MKPGKAGLRWRELFSSAKPTANQNQKLEEIDIFRIIIKIPDTEKPVKDGARPESRSETQLGLLLESKLAAKIMVLLRDCEAGKVQIATRLGHKSVSGELKKQIKNLFECPKNRTRLKFSRGRSFE